MPKVHTNGTNGHSSDPTALANTLGDLRRRFGQTIIQPASALRPAEVIPTGFAALDEALGIGGLPAGRVVDIYGPSSSGKTTLCLHVIASAQQRGGQAAFIDAEYKFDPTWAQKRGVDLGRLLVVRPDTGEQALETADGLIRSGGLAVVVVDSTAALVPKAEIETEVGDAHNHHGAIMSQALRKLVGPAQRAGTLLLFTSQLRQNIGVLFGNSDAPTGGRALRFYATVAIDLRRTEAIKRGGVTVGERIRATVKKNQVAQPFKQATFDLMY